MYRSLQDRTTSSILPLKLHHPKTELPCQERAGCESTLAPIWQRRLPELTDMEFPAGKKDSARSRSVARVSNHLSDPPSFLPLKLVLAITQTTTSGKEGRSRVPRGGGVLRAFLSFPRRIAEKKPHIGNEAARAQQSVQRLRELEPPFWVSHSNLD